MKLKLIFRNSPYLFNAKEFDEETGLYYYGARYYDSRLAMWLGVDALAEKYPNMGVYVYCANNPVKFVDPDGNDVAVLTAPEGAAGAGHMTILIQNTEGKWALYSKNGTNENKGVWGANVTEDTYVEGGKRVVDKGQFTFDTIDDFLNSNTHNPIENGEREYTEAFVIKCKPEQDRKAEEGALEILNEDYNVMTSNCAQTVQNALKKAGFDDGSTVEHSIDIDMGSVKGYKLPHIKAKFKESFSIRPNTLYENIKQNNPQGYVYGSESE